MMDTEIFMRLSELQYLQLIECANFCFLFSENEWGTVRRNANSEFDSASQIGRLLTIKTDEKWSEFSFNSDHNRFQFDI